MLKKVNKYVNLKKVNVKIFGSTNVEQSISSN